MSGVKKWEENEESSTVGGGGGRIRVGMKERLRGGKRII